MRETTRAPVARVPARELACGDVISVVDPHNLYGIDAGTRSRPAGDLTRAAAPPLTVTLMEARPHTTRHLELVVTGLESDIPTIHLDVRPDRYVWRRPGTPLQVLPQPYRDVWTGERWVCDTCQAPADAAPCPTHGAHITLDRWAPQSVYGAEIWRRYVRIPRT